MSAIDPDFRAGAAPAPDVLASAGARLAAASKLFARSTVSAAERIGRAYDIWQAQRQLMRMPSHMLSDIGTSRSEIHSVVRRGRSMQADRDAL